MQVHPVTFHIFQGIAVAAILVIAGTAAYFFMNTNADEAAIDAKRKAEITQLQTRALSYYARLYYYDGVCKAIGADSNHPCHESERAFAVEAQLTDGSYYCADSTGHKGGHTTSKGSSVVCNQ